MLPRQHHKVERRNQKSIASLIHHTKTSCLSCFLCLSFNALLWRITAYHYFSDIFQLFAAEIRVYLLNAVGCEEDSTILITLYTCSAISFAILSFLALVSVVNALDFVLIPQSKCWKFRVWVLRPVLALLISSGWIISWAEVNMVEVHGMHISDPMVISSILAMKADVDIDNEFLTNVVGGIVVLVMIQLLIALASQKCVERWKLAEQLNLRDRHVLIAIQTLFAMSILPWVFLISIKSTSFNISTESKPQLSEADENMKRSLPVLEKTPNILVNVIESLRADHANAQYLPKIVNRMRAEGALIKNVGHQTNAGYSEAAFFALLHSIMPDHRSFDHANVEGGASYPFHILRANNYTFVHIHTGDLYFSCKSIYLIRHVLRRSFYVNWFRV